MINGFSIGNTRMKLLAGAVLFGFATLASAQSAIVVGGGATLPAFGYAGDTTTRLQSPPSDSLLGAYAAFASTTLSYCQTGSGGGKSVLAGNSPSTFTVNADCVAIPNPIGFGATSLGETLTQPHFVGSDSPLAAADLTAYAAGHTSGQPVQIPAVSGAIALVFNNADVGTLNLSETQVCQIFSGVITNWNDSRLTSAGAGTGVPSKSIKVVFRSDGSGTSFAFSNHLSKVCGTSALTGGNGVAPLFKTDQSYSVAAASYLSAYASSVGASGNPGVIAAIQDTDNNDGAIGYAEAANAITSFVQFANVANDNTPTTFVDPTTYGGTRLPVNVNFDEIIASTNSTTGRPVLGPSGLTTQCIGIVNPEDYAKPAAGYPIVAVSYLLANSANNGSDAAHVEGVLFSPYNTSVTNNVDTIGADTGLSYLTINGVTTAQIQSKINGCVN